jgi:hypothetical protein
MSFSRTNRKVILKVVHLTAGFPGKPGNDKSISRKSPSFPLFQRGKGASSNQ